MDYSLHCYKRATEENIISAPIFTAENRVVYCSIISLKSVTGDGIKQKISFRNVKMSITVLKTYYKCHKLRHSGHFSINLNRNDIRTGVLTQSHLLFWGLGPLLRQIQTPAKLN